MRLEKGEKSYIRAAATPWPQQVSSRLWEMNLRKSKLRPNLRKSKLGFWEKLFQPESHLPQTGGALSLRHSCSRSRSSIKILISWNLFCLSIFSLIGWSFVPWMSWLFLDISSTLDVLVELSNLVLTRSERKSKCGALCSSRQHTSEEVASA